MAAAKQLRRRFTPFHMLLLSINGMVGSAWLFAPLYAAQNAGPAALISWVLGGLSTILIALTFAELSTMLPVAGGTTRFAHLSHGATTGFIISWISWLSSVTMPPIEVQAVLQYLSTYFPSLTHLVNGKPILTDIGIMWATLIMLSLCILNVASFKGFLRFNFLLIFFKIFVIFSVIFTLIHASFHPGNFHQSLHPATIGHKFNNIEAILSAVASGGIAFAFTGFKHGVELAGETHNPQTAIPMAIIGSVLICLALYLGLQIAFIGTLSPTMLANGWQHLTFSGDIGPFVGIAALLGIGWLVKLLYIDSIISPLGAGLIYVTSTARIIYAMSKNHYLHTVLSRLNNQHFPIWAISFNFMIGMLLFLPLPGWQAMVSFLVSAVVISYAMGPISLLCLRQQLPSEKRPFRLPCARLLCSIAFYCCNLISYWTGWDTIWKLAIAMVIGLIIYLFAYLRGAITKEQFGLKAMNWLLPYLLGLILISYLGSQAFGGRNVIPFGWDFLVIAIFSFVILRLAVSSRLSDITNQYSLYKHEEVAPTL